MEDKIAILGTHVDHLAKLNDEEEHYQRRLYPSKNGIDLPLDGDKMTLGSTRHWVHLAKTCK